MEKLSDFPEFTELVISSIGDSDPGSLASFMFPF